MEASQNFPVESRWKEIASFPIQKGIFIDGIRSEVFVLKFLYSWKLDEIAIERKFSRRD